MILNYNELEPKKIDNFKGGEKYLEVAMFDDGINKIMKGRLVPGASIGLHRHETNSEVIYILEGKGKVLIEGEYEAVEAGVAHYCPKGAEHSLINDSDADLVYFAVIPEHE